MKKEMFEFASAVEATSIEIEEELNAVKLWVSKARETVGEIVQGKKILINPALSAVSSAPAELTTLEALLEALARSSEKLAETINQQYADSRDK